MRNVDEIYLLPKGSRYFLIALICMILMIIVYWQDILPLRQELIISQQQEKQLTKQLQTLYFQETLLEEKMAELPETKVKLNEWQNKFIKYGDINKLLKEIVAISKRDKLQIKLFHSGPVIQENNYLKQPFKMGLVGDYTQTARFVEQIANLPWTVVVGSFLLVKLPDDDMYSLEMELYVYYLKAI